MEKLTKTKRNKTEENEKHSSVYIVHFSQKRKKKHESTTQNSKIQTGNLEHQNI